MPSSLKFKPAFLVGLCTFLIMLCVYAPASLFSSALIKLSQKHLGLIKESGTIWNGNADLVALDERRQLTLGHMAWQIHVSSVMDRRIAATIVWNGNPPTQFAVSMEGFRVNSLNIDLPARVVAYLEPNLNLASLGGRILATSQQFSMHDGVFDGVVEMRWNKAISGISDINPLGNYLLKIKGNQTLLTLHLNTLGGKLNLQGEGSFSMESGLRFDGVAKAERQGQGLAPLLHAIGNEQVLGSGLFHFNF